MRSILGAAALAVVNPGCSLDTLHVGFDGATGDGEGEAESEGEGDAAAPDGGDAGRADACLPEPESCNGEDDDCDGDVDEDFDKDNDPGNCGACGNACERPNAAGVCVGGDCSYECLPGYWDLDGDLPDPDAEGGCEYGPCIPTIEPGAAEPCNLIDDDCDGAIDEDTDLLEDEENCGGCGQLCLVLNAVPDCDGGECTYAECADGFADILPGVVGCEYECPVFPPEAEVCNGADDDCDPSTADGDGDPSVGDPCGTATGACSTGVLVCVFGVLDCAGEVGPMPETCDGADNDCDGTTDDGFDFLFDPATCGSCDPCDLPFSVEDCSFGTCVVVSCLSGRLDANGADADGCEYECTPTGPEVCDGLDNDCDTLVDEDDLDLLPPSIVCDPDGECGGTTPTCVASPCTGTIGWRCVYSAAVQTDACGAILLEETLCDGLDNDCDGPVDDAYPLRGTPCDDGEIGACRGTGTLECNAEGDDLECVISDPGATPAPADSLCDGLDEDCDGTLDEDVVDEMVSVTVGPTTFWIYAYEASRPDATAAGAGILDHRTCSRPGVLPWRSITHADAVAACPTVLDSAGAPLRLCTEAEWQAACEGPLANAYPYGDAYDPDACNGKDYDPAANAVVPTGAAVACVSDWGALDLSGNLKEWTATEIGTSTPPTYRVRGGAYDNVAGGLACDFDFIALEETFLYPNLGFRCCADSAP